MQRHSTRNTGEWLSLSDATAVLPRPLYDVPFPVFSSLSAKPFRVDTLPQMSRLAKGEKHLEHYLLVPNNPIVLRNTCPTQGWRQR